MSGFGLGQVEYIDDGDSDDFSSSDPDFDWTPNEGDDETTGTVPPPPDDNVLDETPDTAPGTNLVEKPSFEVVGPWSGWEVPYAWDYAYHGANVARINATGSAAPLTSSQRIPVDTSLTYWVSGYGWMERYTTGSARLILKERDAYDNVLETHVVGVWDEPSSWYATIISIPPTSFWRLSETSSNYIDVMGSVDGTVAGTHTRGVTGVLLADTDAAVRLPGSTGSYIDLGDNFDFTGNSAFTVAGWVKSEDFTGSMHVIGKESTSSPNSGWYVSVEGGTYAKFVRYNVDDSFTDYDLRNTPEDPFETGIWYHICATWDGTEGVLYVNAVDTGEDPTGDLDVTLLDSTTTARIGANWDGDLDEFTVWQYALTQDEVSAIYESRLAQWDPEAVRFRSRILDQTDVAWNPDTANVSIEAELTGTPVFDFRLDGISFAQGELPPTGVFQDEVNVAHSETTGITANDHHNEDHNTRHQSGGADPIKLDDLAAPDDNTDLNATITAHGLLPKLSNNAAQFLDGTGAFTTPAGAALTVREADGTPSVSNVTQMDFDQAVGFTVTDETGGDVTVSLASVTVEGNIVTRGELRSKDNTAGDFPGEVGIYNPLNPAVTDTKGGDVTWYAKDTGGTDRPLAAIFGDVASNDGVNSMGTRLRFATRSTGDAALVNRWHLNSTGSFVPLSAGAYDIGSTSNPVANVIMGKHSDTAGDPGRFDFYRRDSTGTGAVADGWTIGNSRWYGHDGTGDLTGAVMRAVIEGTVATNQMPTRLYFSTNSGTAAAVGRWSIAPAGHWEVEADSAYNIGTNTVRPATIYADNLNSAGDITLGAEAITEADWTDLTDGGATTLHTHASSGAPVGADYLVGTADGTLTNEIVVGTSPGGELGGTWASPTVDATHSGSAHHSQSHAIDGGDHTASGLTIGHYMRATGATTFAFAAIPEGDLPSSVLLESETPGGELGGTWASPTVDATHSGSAHHSQSHVLDGGDHTVSGLTPGHVLTALTASTFGFSASGASAPTDADYLVGTANGGLSAEIVVGTTPGGELGGTWASPTVDATHSGSAHHAEVHTVASTGPHAQSGLTAGHVLRASAAAAFDFAALQAGDIPALAYAPDSVDYLVGTASGDLSAEIVVGTSPGGELGGTWASPTVDTTHSGTSHANIPTQTGALNMGGFDISNIGDLYGEDLFLEEINDVANGTAVRQDNQRTTGGALQDNDEVAIWRGRGHDGTGYLAGAEFKFRIDGTVATNDLPTEIVVMTNEGAASATEQWRWAPAGHFEPITDSDVNIGTASIRVATGYLDTVDAGTALTLATGSASWEATPSTQAHGDSAAGGTATTFARGDHKHAMPAAGGAVYGTPALTLSTTNAEGTGDGIRTGATIAAFDATAPDSITFGQAAAAGSAGVAARRDHSHGMAADPVTAHEAAGDPHTGYRLESADHTHATTGLQGGTIAHSVTTGQTATDHHAAATSATDETTWGLSNVTGTSTDFARADHRHGTPADPTYSEDWGEVGDIDSITFGQTASAGVLNEIARADHAHAMVADPVTAHEAAGDPHTGYLQESVISGLATPAIVLGTAAAAGTGTTPIRHNSTIVAFDATVPVTQNYSDAAATGSAAVAARRDHVHGMPAAGSGAPDDADYLVGTAHAGLSAEIVVGTSPGGELGNTWASPTVDTTHSGSSHANIPTQTAALNMGGFSISNVDDLTFAGLLQGGEQIDLDRGDGTAPSLVMARDDGTAMLTSEQLGYIDFSGRDDAGRETGARIDAVANENWGASAHGTDLNFYVKIGSTLTNTWVMSGQDLMPFADSLNDIGSETVRPANIYTDTLFATTVGGNLAAVTTGYFSTVRSTDAGTLTLQAGATTNVLLANGDSLVPTADSNANLGSTSLHFANVYTDAVTSETGWLDFDGLSGVRFSHNGTLELVMNNTTFYPQTDKGLTLGGGINRFNFLYVGDIDVDGDIVPDVDGASDLGTSALNFGDLFLGNDINLYTQSDTEANRIQFHRARDNAGSPELVQVNDVLGEGMLWLSYDGSTYGYSARIQATAGVSPAAGDTPGRLEFATTSPGAAAVTTRWRINEYGHIVSNTPTSYGIVGKKPVVNAYTSSTSSTWTKPVDADGNVTFSHIVVECIGAGGGGGGIVNPTSGKTAGATGGGGGGYARKTFSAADLSAASYSYTVGAGGTGGSSSGTDGTAGTASTFSGTGITTVSGGGGSGGKGDTVGQSGNSTNNARGGGTSSGGDINMTGGASCSWRGISSVSGTASFGGAAAVGGGASLQYLNTYGRNGVTPGGGAGGANASGAETTGTNRVGGEGADGAVIITEFYGP